jgi:hypothetical protein
MNMEEYIQQVDVSLVQYLSPVRTHTSKRRLSCKRSPSELPHVSGSFLHAHSARVDRVPAGPY